MNVPVYQVQVDECGQLGDVPLTAEVQVDECGQLGDVPLTAEVQVDECGQLGYMPLTVENRFAAWPKGKTKSSG